MLSRLFTRRVAATSLVRLVPASRGLSMLSGSSSSPLGMFRKTFARPGVMPLGSSNVEPALGGVLSGLTAMQRRFKSRGNTYQPSTLKRKRKFGFLARLRSRNGRKILLRRREKGRWYLTH